MEFAKSFLADFGVQKSATTPNLNPHVHITASLGTQRVLEEKRGVGCSRGDDDLHSSVLAQPFCDINWHCRASCPYGRRCHEQAGFLPFACKLRKSFWGTKGLEPPSSSERSARAEKIMREFHIQTPNGDSTFRYSYGASSADGKINEIQICEHVFFTALGGGKTSMWYKIQDKLANRGKIEMKENDKAEAQRGAYKSARIRAFINRFLTGCDIPPSKNMANMFILPFPSLEQFYGEYEASFKPNHLQALGTHEVNEVINSKGCLSTFRDVFNAEFAKTCKFMRSRGNHTSCEVCINSATLISDHGREWPPAAEEVN